MKTLGISFVLLSVAVAAAAVPAMVPAEDVKLGSRQTSTQLEGYDVAYFDNPDWQGFANNGTKFAYILATDSTANVNSYFPQHFAAAGQVGLYRGAVHSGSPYSSTGAEQANIFLANGGTWTNDGKTLPGALSIWYAPSRASCWGQTAQQLKAWIWDFSNTYYDVTGRRPVIRTMENFWINCLNSPTEFAADHKLWLSSPDQSSVPGPLPAGWSQYTFWQYQNLGLSMGYYGYPIGYLDKFNGDVAALHSLAAGN